MHHIDIDQVRLSPVSEHECEQVDGGLAIEALISLGVEVIEEMLICVVAGLPCFG